MSAVRKLLGTRKVFLPNILFTLVRSSKLQKNEAMFKVPLHVNKFDIRDYLTHLYNIRVTDVRTYVIPGKPTRDLRTSLTKLSPRQKKAIVTMEEDFTYPEPPNMDNFGKWSLKLQDIIRSGRTKGWRYRMSPKHKAVAYKAIEESKSAEDKDDKKE